MGAADPVPGRRSRGPRSVVRELGAFGVVGATAFLVDVVLFQVLYAVAGVDPVTAKLTSTLVATAVAYLGHRYWSFAHRVRTRVRRSFLLFAAVNTTTLLIGLGVVWFVRYPLGQESALVLQVANLVSIAIGTAIRFLAYRRWVFPAHSPAATAAPGGLPPAGPAVSSPPRLSPRAATRSAR
ncbi:MAG TPA: GtrA family protein [Actinomycetospora sp.]|nr:GtrA family protein [Actinomycetospora sp.]